MKSYGFKLTNVKVCGVCLLLSILSACGSSSSDDEDENGFIKLYNASPNSPDIFLTLDEDLDQDPDDEIEQTYSGVGYGEASRDVEVPTQNYFIELAYQDEESTLRSDLEIIYEGSFSLPSQTILMHVLTDSFPNPTITEFAIPVIDDDDDTDNDLFNLRFLNLHPDYQNIDVYMSKSDETINEAILMGTQSYLGLSDNNKLEEDQYIFYITEAGSTELLFTSVEVSYPFSNQNIIAIRPNFGADTTPFVIDNITNTSNVEYQASNAQSEFRLYNGIQLNELIPSYTGLLEVSSSMPLFVEESFQILTNSLSVGEFTDYFVVENGDYTFDIKSAGTDNFLLQNQLISLSANAQRTLFYHISEFPVDDDGDGNIDENGDGIIDETEAVIQTLVVDNSNRIRIYEHEIEVINLVDDDDFTKVSFSFVKNDENIETAENSRDVGFITPQSFVLRNNTYEVYAVGEIDGRDIILGSQILTLTEESGEQFLIFETDVSSATGYSMRFIDQIP